MRDKDVDAFFKAIQPLGDAYGGIRFNYLAIKKDNEFYLIQGTLVLTTSAADVREQYRSDSILAGSFLLSRSPEKLRYFVDELLGGSISIAETRIVFPARDENQYDVYHDPFHKIGLESQIRRNALTIRGDHSFPYIVQPALDWELMASEVPFSSLQEVANEYNIGSINQEASNIEILAHEVAVISSESQVSGRKASIIVNVASNFSGKNVSIGYNIFGKNKKVLRARCSGTSIKWEQKDTYQTGKVSLEVSEGSLVHCSVSCNGVTQHHQWIYDSKNIPNPRTAAYETFDSNLETLQKVIRECTTKKRAQQFEAAVSCLLWMLGFSIAPIDSVSTGQEVSDLIATTPKGHYAVIECTTGLLKEDNKLPKLHDRTSAVRKKMMESGNHNVHVLPILVTSKTHEEVKPEIEQAEKHGILVLTREDLDSAFNRLPITSDPDELYQDALQGVREAQEKHSEPNAFGFYG